MSLMRHVEIALGEVANTNIYEQEIHIPKWSDMKYISTNVFSAVIREMPDEIYISMNILYGKARAIMFGGKTC